MASQFCPYYLELAGDAAREGTLILVLRPTRPCSLDKVPSPKLANSHHISRPSGITRASPQEQPGLTGIAWKATCSGFQESSSQRRGQKRLQLFMKIMDSHNHDQNFSCCFIHSQMQFAPSPTFVHALLRGFLFPLVIGSPARSAIDARIPGASINS